jgi:hypothetical protein
MSRDSNGGDNRQSSFAALRRFASPRVVEQRGFCVKLAAAQQYYALQI